MVQIHNVKVSLARADEGALQPESAAGNEPPVYAPPYEHVPTVRLPSKEDIAKSIREQHEREVGSAQHESAVAAAAAASERTAGANPFASLGEPAIAFGLSFKPEPALITLSQINDPLAAVALNPQPLPPRALATPAQINDPLAAVALNPQPLPARALATPAEISEPLLAAVWSKPVVAPHLALPRGAMPEAPQVPAFPGGDWIKDAIKDLTQSATLTPNSARPRELDAMLTAGRDPRAAMLSSPAQINEASLASTVDPREAMLATPAQVDEPRGGEPRQNPLPPRGLMMASGGFEGPETPQLPDLPVLDIDRELERALNRKAIRPESASPAQVDDPLAAIGLNPQPLPPCDPLHDIDKARR